MTSQKNSIYDYIARNARLRTTLRAEEQERAIRAKLPWPLRNASNETVRRFPWLFKFMLRRWHIVQSIDDGAWEVLRRSR